MRGVKLALLRALMTCTEGHPYFASGCFSLLLQHSIPTCEGIAACIEVRAYVVRFNIIVTVGSRFPHRRQRVVSFVMESGMVKKKVEQRNTHDLAFSFMRGPEDAAGSRRGQGGDQTWN